jgi:hypothetical protein
MLAFNMRHFIVDLSLLATCWTFGVKHVASLPIGQYNICIKRVAADREINGHGHYETDQVSLAGGNSHQDYCW